MIQKRYWCEKCVAFINPIRGEFIHPHLGRKVGLICPRHSYLVYVKEEKPKEKEND